MKPGIALKLALLLAAVGALVAGLTGLYAYQSSRQLLVESAQGKLLTSTQVLARRITLSREEIARNLLVLASHPAARALLQKPDDATADEIATLFELMMSAHPSYVQMRLISAKDHGLERVRVDRLGHSQIRVLGDDLQEKGHYPYVAETLALRAGQTYLSRITINHEQGAYAGLDQPALQFGMPVVDALGRAIGVMVINIDLNGMFTLLAADLPANYRLFLANEHGDILIHPDASRTFGFDKGRRLLIQDEFAPTAPVVAGRQADAVFEAIDAAHEREPLVAAFIRQPIEGPSHESQLVLGLAQPLAEVHAQAQALGGAIVQIVAGLSLACLLLAALLARAFTRPINALSEAAQRFARGEPGGWLPVQRRDEIGTLARSFVQMQGQITRQVADLQANQEKLEHLAQHDMLTGLPNRRLFQTRLEQALAQARRHGGEVSVLFIDLDRFKEINDDRGHDAGDVVLQAVAARLLATTREGDTVARVGGDEFVVLLGAPATEEQLATIAQKLLDGLRVPILVDGHGVTVGASIGISRSPRDGLSASDLLANADRAMYDAKAAGRDGFRFFSMALA